MLRITPQIIFVYVVLVCTFVAGFAPSSVLSASNTFTIQTQITSDYTPPSIPGSLTATPIAISQINLSWASSTDNSGIIGGYNVWRDGIPIATTTEVTFADTGLTASTTYTYFITAFDQFFNVSGSSTPVSTTTLSIPPPETTEEDGARQGNKLVPFDEIVASIEVIPGEDSVRIRYDSHVYVQTTLQWGRSVSYELGSLAEEAYLTTHETSIVGLTPGVTYTFTINGKDRFGRNGTLYTGTFTTLPPEDIFAPGNVTGLTAVREGDDVLLSWTNPEDRDFRKVRVLRSDRFYPNDTQDGWVVYEGRDREVRDTDAVAGAKQYYTVFTYDALGNVSSGAVVMIRFVDEETATGTPERPDPTKNELKLYFDDIAFMQEGKRLSVLDTGRVHIDGAKQLTISIPYERLPEHLKTILITLTDARNNNRMFSFLLRVDGGRTVYTGTLAPLGVDGEFPITLSVFDYRTAQIGYTKGVLISSIRPIHTDGDLEGVIGGFVDFFTFIGRSYVLWFIILLILLMLLSRRLLRTKY